ncbi:MAG: hypothetical protein R3F18_06735 [Lysobacterales bacterium]
MAAGTERALAYWRANISYGGVAGHLVRGFQVWIRDGSWMR